MKENLDDYRQAYTPEFAYHHDEDLLLRAYSAVIVEKLRGRTNLRLLSLGIGGQLVSATLREQVRPIEYHIVEGSPEIIRKYRQTTNPPANVIIHHAYFEEVELPEAGFDAIEMGFVLEHVDDADVVLRRFLRFLKPGGSLFTAVPNAHSLHRLLGHSAGFLPDLYSLSSSDRALGHKRYFDAASFQQAVEEAGYRVTDRRGLVLKPLTTGQLASLQLDPKIEQAFIDVGYTLPDVCNGIMLVAQRG